MITPSAAMPIMPITVRPARQATSSAPEPEREVAPSNAASRGHKSVLAHAHELADDATALAASFGQRRAGRNDGSQRGTVEEWAGRMLDDAAHEHVRQLKGMIQAHAFDAPGLQQALARLFSDISDAYAALRSLLVDEELAAQRAVLDEAMQLLVEKGGAGAHAGANVANTARAAAARHRGKRRLTAGALRASYRSLLGSDDALQLYVAWLEVFGEDERHAVVDFLTEALVADMCCSDPSCSSLVFGHLLRSARLLSCLRTLEGRFCRDAQLIDLLGEAGLCESLRPMLSSFCDPDEARQWCEELLQGFLTLHEPDQTLQLCMALRRFIKSINSPEVLYPECRSVVLDCLDGQSRRLLEAGRPTTFLLET